MSVAYMVACMIRNCHPRRLGLFLFLFFLNTLSAAEFEKSFRAAVSDFVRSLDVTQTESCMRPLEGKQRWRMQYTGGQRPGIQINQLNPKQRKLLERALQVVLSPYGWKMANEVAKQDAKNSEDPLGKYWITCFGDPRKDDFAFRLAEHHLTIVHLEVAHGETKEFGPILLGANPPSLWKVDEQLLLAAWKNMDNKTALMKDKKGVASKAMTEGEGVMFCELSVPAQTAIKAAFQRRLNLFTKPLIDRIYKLHQARGGWEKSKVAFYNEVPTKRSIEGGRWDFKCG
ncbi:MAG: DUF3500 domain-containing protein [Verrucomicrobiae bacterium]|nr:DUF3500 domain-containing protein [Verrucomicrobiae bacterium]NNJ87253.1 DUF3500 domain-containing protein [Akkermansiaceae bacterium]